MHDDQAGEWQALMEGLVIGALRGMAMAHEQISETAEGRLPPLDELTMFHAGEVLMATLLEASPECREPRRFAQAAQTVRKDLIAHMTALRGARGPEGEPVLETILGQAGLDRVRRH